MKSLRVLNYAVNGVGLGHLSRLLAINRWIRRLTGVLGVRAEIAFLTSSEADTLAYHHGFAAFKIPSKSVIRSSGLSPERYNQLAKQWVWNAVGLFQPDLMIVDTFPAGSFRELGSVADFGFQKTFVYRAVRPEQAQSEAFQKALGMYDRIILVAESAGSPRQEFYLPPRVEARARQTGAIALFEREELLPRAEARERLGLDPEGFVCYLTAGGGGDAFAEETLGTLARAAARIADAEFVAGAGALYRGKEFRSANVSWSYRYDFMRYLNAFDCAVSAGGYNSAHELLYCGAPTLFFPQERLFDDQWRRVRAFAERGACLTTETITADVLREYVGAMREAERRSALSEAAREAVPLNCAREAARLALETVVPEERLDAAEAALSGKAFWLACSEGVPEEYFLQTLALTLKDCRNLDDEEYEELGGEVLRLLAGAHELGATYGDALRLARHYLRAGKTSEDNATASNAAQRAKTLAERVLRQFREWRQTGRSPAGALQELLGGATESETGRSGAADFSEL